MEIVRAIGTGIKWAGSGVYLAIVGVLFGTFFFMVAWTVLAFLGFVDPLE